METNEKMNEAQKAWLVWKKLEELKILLWNTWYREFQKLDTREKMLRMRADNLPF